MNLYESEVVSIKRPAGFATGMDNAGIYYRYYPYNRLVSEIKEAMEVLRMQQFPFEIVDRSEGVSTCSVCGATYVGWQGECIVQQDFVYKKTSYYEERHCFKKSPMDVYNDYIRARIVNEKCYSRCDWNLESRFKEQQAFFDGLFEMASIVRDWKGRQNWIDKYYTFTGIKPEFLWILYLAKGLENTVVNIDSQIMEIKCRLNEVSNVCRY